MAISRSQKLTMPLWYLLVTIVGSLLLLIGGGYAYINYAIKRQDAVERENDHQREAYEREQDRRWCSLLTQIDDANKRTPPASEAARRFAATIHQLRLDLGCT